MGKTTKAGAQRFDQGQLESLVAQILGEAKAQGATAADADVSISNGLSVTVRLGDVETIEYNRDKALGVTVYFGNRKANASTHDFSARAVKETVLAACNIAKHTAEDPCAHLADPELLAKDIPDLDLYYPWDVTAEQAIEIAKACEDAARAVDARITNSEGATLSSHQGFSVYGNTHGFVGSYPSTRHSISCSVIAEEGEGMQRDYWYSSARDRADLDEVESVGRTAAHRAVRRLSARRLKTCQAPVVYASDVAAGIISHLVGAISGGSLYRGTSFLVDHLGKQIFPSFMHIREEPHLKKGTGSAPFDSEGVATRARDLVKDGVLQGYVLGTYSACKLGMQSTGNAGGVHNLRVATGDVGLEGLLKQMGKGLLVTELMGQGVNKTTGDYSRGAAGFWVENGEVQYAVEEITIAGNLRDMFMGIVAIGNDVDRRRNIQTGSILINNMMIAGE